MPTDSIRDVPNPLRKGRANASEYMPYKKLKYNPVHNIAAMFQEAISHSRRKGALRALLMSPELQETQQYANQSFDDIFLHIHTLCYVPKTIGLLCIYDITAATITSTASSSLARGRSAPCAC